MRHVIIAGFRRGDTVISLRQARIDERRTIFEWLARSTTTPLFMGPPLFPEVEIPDWEQFQKDFENFYFLEAGRDRGSVFVIERNGAGIGCVCYSCFHLQAGSAELDIWMADVRHCGHGFGVQALRLLIDDLRHRGIGQFLIRPAERNLRAIRAYEKAGFARVSDKAATIKSYLLPEYLALYGPGDAGFEGTAVLTLE